MSYAPTVTWKRFKPHLRGRIDDKTLYEPESIYAQARIIRERALRETSNRGGVLARNSRAVQYLKQHLTRQPEYLLATVVLQAPGAAEAQRQMDRHHGGYKNRDKRLFELIDFNDSFVDTVLVLEDEELLTFTKRFRAEIDTFCKECTIEPFDDDQFSAIVHGLSREIAVYRGARALGYRVRMTSRVLDSKGVDMVITDPQTKKSLNIDVKTHSAFHFRLLELQQQRRITEERRLECELAGFCSITNGRNQRAVHTTLFRIATDRLGPIHHYQFVDTTEFGTLLERAISNEGQYIL